MASITIQTTTRSNRDWKTLFEFTDAETGALIDFTGAIISLAVDDVNGRRKIDATTANGKITIVALGRFQVYVPASEMNLCAGSYNVGCGYKLNNEIIDLFGGTLSIAKGIPTL